MATEATVHVVSGRRGDAMDRVIRMHSSYHHAQRRHAAIDFLDLEHVTASTRAFFELALLVNKLENRFLNINDLVEIALSVSPCIRSYYTSMELPVNVLSSR